ncbi:MAG: DUF1579 family protein, partial [bacterium]
MALAAAAVALQVQAARLLRRTTKLPRQLRTKPARPLRRVGFFVFVGYVQPMPFLLSAIALLSVAQQHDLKPAEALKSLEFMKGDWAGKQEFNTQGGAAMTGDATNHISDAIGGRYLCEMLSTSLPGRKPTDTRHFISFDPKTQKYTAWWFTD